jgi:hypothetical protein
MMRETQAERDRAHIDETTAVLKMRGFRNARTQAKAELARMQSVTVYAIKKRRQDRRKKRRKN